MNSSIFMNFGQHRFDTVAEVMLKNPSYIAWMFEQENPQGRLAEVIPEALRLIDKFDAMPFQTKCSQCQRPATRCSVYGSNLQPMFWCGECSPYSAGASPGKLQVIETYRDALLHARTYCSDRQPAMKRLVEHLARAKGLVS